LRALTEQFGALLVFDEVMTGFRIAYGGARERFGVVPDLTTLGKVIGGGLPVGAYGGRRATMECVAPSGPVYQAGTLSGNPLAMAAGIATLETLTPVLHDQIATRTTALVHGLVASAARHGVPFTADAAGSMWGFFFRGEPVRSFADARTSNAERFRRFFHAALDRGVYLAPSPYEAAFMSAAHSDNDVALALEALDAAMHRAAS
jgi:glutamate-1-semialdehyde 2,1-aminomutase